MPDYRRPFSGFSGRDVAEAADFYRHRLGLEVLVDENGMGTIDLGDGHRVLFYPKGDAHVPASFTVLNLPVDDVGVMRGNGPDIAWLTDPSGNVFSVIAAE